DQAVEIERPVLGSDPFGPGRGTAATALVDRQLQLADQPLYLLARRHMRDARPRSERGSLDLVERGQPVREELAVDHALRQTIGRAETEPQPEPVKAFADEFLVARRERPKAVADHDPIGQATVD